VQVDPVEIVTGFLGRDRELRGVDQLADIGSTQRETVAEVAGRQIREIGLRQHLQCEFRTARPDFKRGIVSRGLQDNLRSFRKLAHDVVEHMRGNGRRAWHFNHGRYRLDDLEIQVGRLQVDRVSVGAQEDVGQDGNGVTPLDHPVNVRQGLEEIGPLEGRFHTLLPCS